MTVVLIILAVLVPGALRAGSHADVIHLTGPIGPISVRHIDQGIERAEEDSAECLVVMMDTPGGLLESTQLIIKSILSSNIPVAVYIAPSGAGAGSAGVFITLSAHIAAMAPGTNIGAAHPVGLQGSIPDSTMSHKIENFSASYIRSIAEKRGRNGAWAERAVRESVAITDREAVALNVVDLVASDLDSLMIRIDGQQVEVREGIRTLHTRNAEIRLHEMAWHFRILSTLSNPNIAYLLMMLGFYGLIYEIINPGAVFPGVVGGICIIVGLFSLQTLPINYAGLLLILLGIGLFIAETQVASHGALALGGSIATLIGSMMLIDSPYPFMRISLSVIIPVVLATAGFFLFAVGFAVKAQKRRPTTGLEGLIGATGVAISAIRPKGQALVHGEYWTVQSPEPIEPGEGVRVVRIEGLTLHVVRHQIGETGPDTKEG
jgi:membrane-bound serine protease (ClpP class)